MKVAIVAQFFMKLSGLAILLLFGVAAMADSQVPVVFHANPESIRTRLLSENIGIVQAFNRVKDSKDQLTLARTRLLPSLSLTAVSGASFGIGSISVLLPFLLPSNYFNMNQQRELFEAEKESFRIFELNTYSSALAIYFQALADQQSQALYEQEAQDLADVALRFHNRLIFGLASVVDTAQAEASSQEAQNQALRNAELAVQENVLLKGALGLSVNDGLILDAVDMPASPAESSSVEEVFKTVSQIAPERLQIDYLVKAAEDAKWSTAFSFLTVATLSGQQNSSGSAFSNMTATGTVNLGFGLIPQIELSNRNIEEIRLQYVQLGRQQGMLVESSIKSAALAHERFQRSLQVETEFEKVYQGRLAYYKIGVADLLDVLVARRQFIEASIQRVQTMLDLNNQRITIHRQLLSHQFALIKGCGIRHSAAADQGGWDWWKRVFGGGAESQKTLLEVCRESASTGVSSSALPAKI